MQQESPEERTLPTAAEREQPILLDYLEWAQKTEFHVRSTDESQRPYHRTTRIYRRRTGARFTALYPPPPRTLTAKAQDVARAPEERRKP
jgi:hypothetical protein